MFNRPVPDPASAAAAPATDYRLSPQLAARLLGLVLAAVGVLVCGGTVLVAVLSLPAGAVGVLALLALVTVFGCGAWLTRRTYVVRLTAEGYRVRFVRGVGVARGRWVDVDDAVTADVAGSPCVVLRRRDGSTTTVPVELLAGSPDSFVRDVQARLQRGHRLRRLG